MFNTFKKNATKYKYRCESACLTNSTTYTITVFCQKSKTAIVKFH